MNLNPSISILILVGFLAAIAGIRSLFTGDHDAYRIHFLCALALWAGTDFLYIARYLAAGDQRDAASVTFFLAVTCFLAWIAGRNRKDRGRALGTAGSKSLAIRGALVRSMRHRAVPSPA